MQTSIQNRTEDDMTVRINNQAILLESKEERKFSHVKTIQIEKVLIKLEDNLYVDKQGRKWDNDALDSIFNLISEQKKNREALDYYAVE